MYSYLWIYPVPSEKLLKLVSLTKSTWQWPYILTLPLVHFVILKSTACRTVKSVDMYASWSSHDSVFCGRIDCRGEEEEGGRGVRMYHICCHKGPGEMTSLWQSHLQCTHASLTQYRFWTVFLGRYMRWRWWNMYMWSGYCLREVCGKSLFRYKPRSGSAGGPTAIMHPKWWSGVKVVHTETAPCITARRLGSKLLF